MDTLKYCCSLLPLPDTCHHNIEINGVKKHVKDTKCAFNKSNIKEAIIDGIANVEDGWPFDCPVDNFCEVI